MIISASRRTDIPAFYGDWFMNRVREGFFYRVNPYNSNQVSGFSLKPEHVDAVCFWTKDPRPLMRHLDELDGRGLMYYFQFTLNPYGPEFEPHLPPHAERIDTFIELAGRIGPKRVIWRYDPVILTGAMPVERHLEQVELLAGKLHGATVRLIFSFCDFYGKNRGRLQAAPGICGTSLADITVPSHAAELDRLARGFKAVADRHGLAVFTCSEAIDLAETGIERGACIDGTLVRELFGGTPSTRKDRYQRRECGCVESADMGMYNTCRFGCTYCYAGCCRELAGGSLLKHYPDSPSLLGRYMGKVDIRTSLGPPKKHANSRQQFFDSTGHQGKSII